MPSNNGPNIYLIIHYEDRKLVFSEWMYGGVFLRSRECLSGSFHLAWCLRFKTGYWTLITIFPELKMPVLNKFVHLFTATLKSLCPGHGLHVRLLTLKVLWWFPLFYISRGFPQLSNTFFFSLEFPSGLSDPKLLIDSLQLSQIHTPGFNVSPDGQPAKYL